jgi:hypothetical protein
VFLGERQELLAAGLDGLGRGFHRLSVIVWGFGECEQQEIGSPSVWIIGQGM